MKEVVVNLKVNFEYFDEYVGFNELMYEVFIFFSDEIVEIKVVL